jgi:RNA polymerase sigma-70 factor (ECF subfamily)
MLKNAAEAEEVCQEVFLILFQKAYTYKGKSSASTWIYRIATNCALMKLRRQTKTPELAVENGWLGFEEGYRAPMEHVAKWPKGPEKAYLNNEIRTLLEKALAQLPEKYRIVLLLKDVEGLSLSEISKTLGLTVASVKSRIHRSRLYIREQLDNYFKENHRE